MNLRTRILLGYGYLVALILLGAVGAAIGFQQLGTNIAKVLSENVRSVKSSADMVEALERQDSALLAELLEPGSAVQDLAAADVAFDHALAAAAANITLDTEDRVVASIRQRIRAWRDARAAILARHPERPLRAYEQVAFPAFVRVKEKVSALVELNRTAMEAADQHAQLEARRRAILHAVLATVALVSLVLISRELNRTVLARLEELETVARHIADGHLGRRATVEHDDELGEVARQLNAVLDRHAELEGRTRGLLRLHRQSILGLLASLATPAALLDLSGAMVASTLDESTTTCLEGVAGSLSDADRHTDAGGRLRIESGGRKFELSPLVAPPGRPVGWLAREDGSSKL
jgi:HAMP domain-containing protein